VKLAALSLAAAAIVAQPLANDDVLEPSVLNEVEHAISVAPTNPPPPSAAWDPKTNGLSQTAVAIRLVASQRADGRWLDGTNDVTAAALRLLEAIADESR
jgi:hypothetical protein